MPITSNADLLDGALYHAGQLASTETSVVRSGFNEGTVILPFGLGLVRGSKDKALVLPSATGFSFAGVCLLNNSIEKVAGWSLTTEQVFGSPVDHTTSFVRRGIIAVPIDSDCVEYGPVYLIHTASSGQVPGHFRKDANTDQADLIPNAVFLKTLTAAGIGLISLNLP